jgi:xanthine dehydrogenase molybdenum-binding subunit
MSNDVIGRPVPAVQNQQLLTGIARFTNDLHMPGMLVGKILYSAQPCAHITKLDVEAARSLPGVVAVLTHTDIPGENSYFYHEADQPLLVSDRINYLGDAIVALAAQDEETAQAALDGIKVVYEPLPGVFDPLEAMQPDAPLALPGYENVLSHTVYDFGDYHAGFSEADVIVENTFHTPWIEHAYLEPEGALAYIDLDGTMVVYASNQAPNRDRMQIARALGIAEHRVRVVTPYIGGAFGAKEKPLFRSTPPCSPRRRASRYASYAPGKSPS